VPVPFVANSTNETLRAYGLDPSALPVKEARELLRTTDALETDDFFTAMFDLRDQHFKALRPAARALFDSAERFSTDIQAQLRRLGQAVDAGLLDIGGWSDQRPELFEREELYVRRAGEALIEAVVNGTSPLVVDAGASMTLGMAGRTVHELQIAEDLLRPLPAFSRATVDEILDIRKELTGPLSRFRIEVAEIAENINQEGDYIQQLNGIWQRKVRPALDELDELTQENSYLRQLTDKITEAKTMLPAGATFALGIGGLTGLAQVAAASAAVAAVPLEALRAKVKEGRALRRKRLYFLWKLGQR
jgi:hypothetical protein